MKEILFSNVDIDDILNRNVAAFLYSIRQSVMAGSKSIHLEKPEFPIFGIHNPEFYEQLHYENTLNRNICDHLINDILFDLFSLRERIDDTVKLLRFDKKSNDFGYSGIRDCHPAPFAFILEIEKKRIGYWYKEPRNPYPYNKNRLMIKYRMIKYRLHHIEVFRWSEKTGIIKRQEKDSIIQSISIHTFMLEYFSQEIYTRYVNCVKDAIQEAKNIIGYQTISKLSLRHLWNFKFSEMESLREENNKLHNLHYHEFSEEGKLKDTTFDLLPPEDYEVIDYRFFEKGLYKSLSGNEPFARCFMTSEYLYRTIKAGKEHYFDYSSIVTGYFKSVELLLYKIVDATLQMKGHETLWITCERPSNQSDSDYQRMNNFWHVKFKSEHKKEFKTEMGSLVNFVEHNKIGWNLSQQGKQQVVECIKNYNQGCRNQHLHKDLIVDTEPVEKIRDNTLLCIYYLVGGCKLADDENNEEQVLGVVDDSYDRLYREIKKVSVSVSN